MDSYVKEFLKRANMEFPRVMFDCVEEDGINYIFHSNRSMQFDLHFVTQIGKILKECFFDHGVTNVGFDYAKRLDAMSMYNPGTPSPKDVYGINLPSVSVRGVIESSPKSKYLDTKKPVFIVGDDFGMVA